MTPRARSLLRAAAAPAAAVGALLLGGALALEVGSRIWFRVRGKPLDVEARRAWILSVLESMENRGDVASDLAPAEARARPADDLLLEPYVAWQDVATEARMIDDAEAYARPDAKAAFDVLLLGGAAAEELGKDARLAERLAADPRCQGREVRVHVYAREGFKEPQPMILLACLLAHGHEPDFVVAVGGRDDAALGARNALAGTHPLFPSVEHWARATRGMRSDWQLVDRIDAVRVARERARAYAEWFLAAGLERSAFFGHFALGKLAGLHGRAIAAADALRTYAASRPRDAELDGPRFDTSETGVADTIAGGWERAAILMHAMCERREIPFLQVLEPIPASEDGLVPESLRAAAGRLLAARVDVLDASRLQGSQGTGGADGDGLDPLAEAVAGAWARGPVR